MNTFDVTVRGLGFTGLATAVLAARSGFRVVGLDYSPVRVRQINEVRPGCGLTTVSETELRAHLSSGMLTVQDLSGVPPRGKCHVICVPTPAGNSDGADLTALMNAVESVAISLRAGDLVLVQSTCPPGVVERFVLPRLARLSGLRAGSGLHVAHSPVRLDPGVPGVGLEHLPRVVAGATTDCTDRAVAFLGRIAEHVVPVSAIRVAELTKVFENTFRLVNISLVNELAAYCRESDVDVAEVLDAAATKPSGFLRHQPGPGAGGDCVPVAAAFFAGAMRREGVTSAVVDAALAVNDSLPAAVLRRVDELLAGRCLPRLAEGRVLVVGVTYKPDVANVRRSAAVQMVERLRSAGQVAYHDPLVPSLRLADGTVLHSTEIGAYRPDVALVVTRHSTVDHAELAERATVVVDCTTGVPRFVAGEAGHAH